MNKPARRVSYSIIALTCVLAATTPVAEALPVAAATPIAASSPSPTSTTTSSSSPSAKSGSTSDPVTIAIGSVDPIAPPATSANTTVTVTLTVTNTGSSALSALTLTAMREAPLISQSELDDEIDHPSRSSSLLSPLPTESVTGELDAHQTRTLTYTFETSTIDARGIACFCQAGVYPVDIALQSASSSNAGASHREVGWTQTYLPYVPEGDSAQTGWVWPLIDAPHRGLDPDVFTDDALSAEVAPGGRLDKALSVVEQVGATAKLSVVIDPELIDELAAMTHGYRVAAAGDTTVAGTGGVAAAAWLTRLRTVLATLPGADVSLTPYADPDIDAATAAGLDWTTALPAEMRTTVDAALGGHYTNAFAWPPGETVSSAALEQLVAGGASSVLLDDATLPADNDGSDSPDDGGTVSTLPGFGSTTAVVTDSALDKRAASAMTSSGGGAAQDLIAQLAMQALTTDDAYTVFVPDRRITVDPALAVRIIAATTDSGWLSAVSPATATDSITPVAHRPLSTQSTGAVPAASSPTASRRSGSSPGSRPR